MENLVKNYEIGFLVVNDEDANEVMSALLAHKAEILNDGKTKKIRFAYKVEKHTAGSFGYIQFAVDAASIKPLTEKLKLNKKVLRFMIMILPAIAMRQPRAAEEHMTEKTAPKVEAVKEEKKVSSDDFIDNELLEKKLEEILK